MYTEMYLKCVSRQYEIENMYLKSVSRQYEIENTLKGKETPVFYQSVC